MVPALLTLALLAQPANPYLDEARALAGELKFGEALARLEVAKKVPGLDRAQRREVLELTARCHVAEGNREQAEAAFTELLRDQPSFDLDRAVSPKILEVFDAAKVRLYPRDYLVLEEVPAPAGRVMLKLVDPWRRVRTVTRHERRDGGAWSESPLEAADADGLISFALVVAEGSTAEWFVEASGDDGAIARVGSLEQPRVVSALRVEAVPRTVERESRGVHTAGWVALGVAVVAAGIATGLQVNGWNLRQAARDGTRPPGDWADTARRAEADGVAQTGWATGLFISAGVLGAGGTGLLLW